MRYVLIAVVVAFAALIGFLVVDCGGDDEPTSERGAKAQLRLIDERIEHTEQAIERVRFSDNQRLNVQYQKLAELYQQKKELHTWLAGRYDDLSSKYDNLADGHGDFVQE